MPWQTVGSAVGRRATGSVPGIAVSLNAPVLAGDLVVLGVAAVGATMNYTITDSAGSGVNTWTFDLGDTSPGNLATVAQLHSVLSAPNPRLEIVATITPPALAVMAIGAIVLRHTPPFSFFFGNVDAAVGTTLDCNVLIPNSDDDIIICWGAANNPGGKVIPDAPLIRAWNSAGGMALEVCLAVQPQASFIVFPTMEVAVSSEWAMTGELWTATLVPPGPTNPGVLLGDSVSPMPAR